MYVSDVCMTVFLGKSILFKSYFVCFILNEFTKPFKLHMVFFGPLIGLGVYLCLGLVWGFGFWGVFKPLCLLLWSCWFFVIITSRFCNLPWPKDKINTDLSLSSPTPHTVGWRWDSAVNLPSCAQQRARHSL